MSANFYFSFGLILSILLYVSCSSIYHPIDGLSNQERHDFHHNKYENGDIPMMIHPKSSLIDRFQRSSAYHPRASRNSWFRVSSYQHMKPTSESDEKATGDNLLRWG